MRHPGACVSWKRAPTEGGIIRENTSTGTTRQLRACTIWERALVEGMCQRRRRHPMGRLGRECVPAACAHRPPSFFGKGTHTFAPSPHTPFCLLAAHVSITRPITKPAKEVVERRLAKVEMKAKNKSALALKTTRKEFEAGLLRLDLLTWQDSAPGRFATPGRSAARQNDGTNNGIWPAAIHRTQHRACCRPQSAASSLRPQNGSIEATPAGRPAQQD